MNDIYITGKLLEQKKNTKKDLELKRINDSIKATYGKACENILKYYLDNSDFFSLLEQQKFQSLKKEEYLTRYDFILNNKNYDFLKIYNFENNLENDFKLILFSKDNFYNVLLKQKFNIKLSTIKKEFREKEVYRLLLDYYKNYIKNAKILKNGIELHFHQVLDKFELLKDLCLISTNSKTIRSDFLVKDIKKNKVHFIELKSRKTTNIKKSDIYSSIFYPLYYNQKFNDSRDLYFIYIGELSENVRLEAKRIKRNYEKITGSKFYLKSFQEYLQILINKYKNPDLLGIKIKIDYINPKDNKPKYFYKNIFGILQKDYFFLDFDYIFNFSREITKLETDKKISENEIDSRVRL